MQETEEAMNAITVKASAYEDRVVLDDEAEAELRQKNRRLLRECGRRVSPRKAQKILKKVRAAIEKKPKKKQW